MRRISIRRAACAALAFWVGVVPGHAQSRSERTDAFEVAFGLSLVSFDSCGDPASGALFRRALVEKFDRCPFSGEARRRFHHWAEDAEKRVNEALALGGADRDRKDCPERRDASGYRVMRDLLERYAKGEVGADAVVPGACDAQAGSP